MTTVKPICQTMTYSQKNENELKTTQRKQDDQLIAEAKAVIYQRLVRGPILTNPKQVKDFLILELSQQQVEVFCCLFLDNQHQLIEKRVLFTGTIDGCSVYPREVVKMSLRLNAAAVIFAHNHPSKSTTPSQADKDITKRLKEVLALVDIRVLDHFVVGGTTVLSFAEKGLL